MIERSQDRIDETGEVFTPSDIVNEMLDLLPKEIWNDPTKTFLEPSTGDGNFLIVILERLMIGLESWEPDQELRKKHIIENQIFGIDIMQDNINECIKRLDCNHLNHNLMCADYLEYNDLKKYNKIDDLFEVVESKPKNILPKNKIIDTCFDDLFD